MGGHAGASGGIWTREMRQQTDRVILHAKWDCPDAGWDRPRGVMDLFALTSSGLGDSLGWQVDLGQTLAE